MKFDHVNYSCLANSAVKVTINLTASTLEEAVRFATNLETGCNAPPAPEVQAPLFNTDTSRLVVTPQRPATKKKAARRKR